MSPTYQHIHKVIYIYIHICIKKNTQEDAYFLPIAAEHTSGGKPHHSRPAVAWRCSELCQVRTRSPASGPEQTHEREDANCKHSEP